MTGAIHRTLAERGKGPYLARYPNTSSPTADAREMAADVVADAS